MRMEILSKNYTPSEKLKDLITKKVERLDKFFDADTKVKIMLKESNEVYSLELTINLGSTILRSEVSSDNMYGNIDIALPKVEKQLIKHRTKLASKSKKFRVRELDMSFDTPQEPEKENTLVKSKTYILTPMSVEDAIDEMELVGHSFYVFNNKLTKNVNVVYIRNDGDYGLIETVQE